MRNKLYPGPKEGPKILVYDCETAPIQAYVWGLWNNDVGLSMVKSDWHLLAWSAKWLGDPASKTMYMDQRGAKDIEDDRKILKGIWKLLNEADVVITQNGKYFDEKKLNARFFIWGMKPPSQAHHIDTKQIAKKKFGFTSNKLEYMTEKVNTKYRKLTTKRKFTGFELWKECMAGNLAAWKDMERYNRYDVLSLEELYLKMEPWDNSTHWGTYYSDKQCSCGNEDIVRDGYKHTKLGKFQRYQCKSCGKKFRDNINLLSTDKRKKTLRSL